MDKEVPEGPGNSKAFFFFSLIKVLSSHWIKKPFIIVDLVWTLMGCHRGVLISGFRYKANGLLQRRG